MRCVMLLLSALLIPMTAFASTPWPAGDWFYRVKITANPFLIMGAETFTDFALPVLLNDTDHPDVFADAAPDGSDLYFTLDDGVTTLEREIVEFNPVAGSAEIWVRVPSFSDLENQLYLYFDHPDTALDPTPTAAWSDDYRVVYHFEENPADLFVTDSSPQQAHASLFGSLGWTSSDVAPGPLGQAFWFNGDTHWLSSSAISSTDSTFAISGWLAHTERSTDFFFQTNPGFWALASQVVSDEPSLLSTSTVWWEPDPIPINDGFHHFLWMFDAEADTVTFYYDGLPQPVNRVFPIDGAPFYTGSLINPTQSDPVGVVGSMFYYVEDLHAGGADEFRIRQGPMSADRIRTEFLAQSANTTFLSFGPTESRTGTAAPDFSGQSVVSLRAAPNPASGRSMVEYSLPGPGHVRISVYDLAGRRIDDLVDEVVPAGRWSVAWDGRSRDGNRLAAGVYLLRLESPFGTRSTKVSLVR